MLQTNTYRPEYFPISQNYIGELPQLIGQSIVIVGPTGSGRRRIIHENIRIAYLEGTPTYVAIANPLHPFGLWKQILEDILKPLKLNERTERLKGLEQTLSILLPDIISTEKVQSSHINTEQLTNAIEIVLQRSGDLCIVLLNLDQADIGSLEITKEIWGSQSFSIWGVSTRPFDWSETLTPTTWTEDYEKQLLGELLPNDLNIPKTKTGRSPLQSSIKAWHSIAEQRLECCLKPGLSTKTISTLGLLSEPFSRNMVESIVSNLEQVLENGILQEINPNEFQFSFLPQKWMLNEYLDLRDIRTENHLILVDAWYSEAKTPIQQRQQMYHSILATNLVPKHLVQALWQALLVLNIESINQWWQLSLLHRVVQHTTPIKLAEIFINISNNHYIDSGVFKELIDRPLSDSEITLLSYLQLLNTSGENEYRDAILIAQRYLKVLDPRTHMFYWQHIENYVMYLKNTIQTSQQWEHILSLDLQNIFPQMVSSCTLSIPQTIR